MIFSGIELLFFALGVLTTLSIVAIVHYNKKYKLSWKIVGLLLVSAFLAVFAVAWSGSSLIEGENQAAGVGGLFFGFPAFIGFFIARKRILNSK